MQHFHGLLQLTGHVDVPLGSRVALVPHELLKGVSRQPLGVNCGEGPAQVVEAVAVAGVGMLVFLGAGKVNAGRASSTHSSTMYGRPSASPRPRNLGK